MTNKRARKSKTLVFAPLPAKKSGPNISPTKVLDVIRHAGYPLNIGAIARRLNSYKIGDGDLLKLLDKLERALKVVNLASGYVITDPNRLIEGTIKTARQGAGFIVPYTDGAQEGYLTEQSMAGLFEGDRVTGYLTSTVPVCGKIEARLLRIDSVPPEILGTVCLESGRAVAKPLHAEGVHFSLMEGFGASSVTDLVGMVVRIRLVERPAPGREARAEVVQVIGSPEDRDVVYKVALIENNIVEQFGEKAIKEAADARQPEPTNYRKDLTDLPFFTIDDDSTNDLDDALAGVVRGDGSVTVYVAIADVAELIKPNSLLDRVARQRGTSVYLPGRTIPMLPHTIGLEASLAPLARRAAMVVQFKLRPDGSLSDTKFLEAWIQSRARISYKTIDRLITTGHLPLAPTEVLHSIACVAQAEPALRCVSLKDVEEWGVRPFVDPDDGRLTIAASCVESPSRRLVQSWMVAANHAAAVLLNDHDATALYRVQELPSADAIRLVERSLRESQIDPPSRWSATNLEQLYLTMRGHPKGAQLARFLSGVLPAARYSDAPGLHSSLAKDAYVHFTSPIRRYADIFNHRAIKAIIRKSKRSRKPEQGLGREMTAKRHAAQSAERAVSKAILGRSLLSQKQPSFPGTVIGTQKFGCFVRLNDYPGLDGLVHISSISGQNYRFDEAAGVFEGAGNRRRITMGSQVQVALKQVCPWSGRIEMSILN